jgi:hypothetical protein
MSRAVAILGLQSERKRAADWCMKAPAGTAVEFKESKRTTEQNSRLWAMLTEVARQVPWHGVRLTPDDWKLIFMDALNQEMRLVPNLNGNGFINLGRSSSRLTKAEFGDLMTLIEEFGARHGVVFHDSREDAA